MSMTPRPPSIPADRRLAVSVIAQGPRTLVALAGRLDEQAVGLSTVAQISTREVVINLGGITFINSLGVREWVRALRTLLARHADVTLAQVSAVLVPQMNMVREMSAGTKISSFEAPYSCPKCGHEGPMLIEVGAHGDLLRRTAAPALPCPECKGTMSCDEIPAHYFMFLELDQAARTG